MAELDGARVGNYHILRRIGGGGMGDVYLAEQTSLGRLVVIKVMRGEESIQTDAEAKARQVRQFMQEARAIASLDHPHILPLYDYGEEGHIRFLVMAYVPDGSLADLLSPGPSQRLHLPLPPLFVAEIITESAEALQFAHDHGIIHRDVKPGNLLIHLLSPRSTGTSERRTLSEALESPRIHVLLADFGLARLLTELAEGTATTGTPLYNAPEQYHGRPVPATDQYALACVAYLLLAGKPVFSGTVAELYHQHLSVTPRPATQVNALLPPAVDTPLLRALAKSPEQRFPRILDFAQALEATIRPASLASRPLAMRANVSPSARQAPEQSPHPVATPPALRPTQHADGIPAALPEPRLSRPQGSQALPSLLPEQPIPPRSPTGAVATHIYSDAPGATIPSRPTGRSRWRNPAGRRLVIGSAILLVIILLGSVGLTLAQRLHSPTVTHDDMVRITGAGKIDLEQLPVLDHGTASTSSDVAVRLRWTQSEAAAQAQAADHLSALPVLPSLGPAPSALAGAVPGKLPAESLTGLGQSVVAAPAPLDVSLASDRQFVVEAVDGAFQIEGLDVAHSTHLQIAAASLFKPVLQAGDTLGEPRVFFDSASGLWVSVMNELRTRNGVVSAGFFDVAISDTDQPTTGWSVYQFSTSLHGAEDATAPEDWADDPQIGNDSQAFYITGNLFATSTGTPFLGSVVYDLPKRVFATGRASVGSPVYILSGFANLQKNPALGVIPAQNNGTENTEWLISNDAGYVDEGQTSNTIIVWAITNPAAVNSGNLPSLVGVVVKLPRAYADPPMAVQKGSSTRLTNDDARFAQLYFSAGHLYGAFTTAVNWAGDAATRSGIYWLDLVPTLPGRASKSPVTITVAQQGIYGFTGDYTFDPALIPTLPGDLALFVEASSAAFYPSFVSITRRSTDPVDQLGGNGQVLVALGGAPVVPYAGSHWSDYIGASASPATGNQSSIVWGAGPYLGMKTAYWQTLLWQVQPGRTN